MTLPNLKRMFKSCTLKVGHSIFEFNSPGIGQIIAAAGVDFVFLDMEHSGFGIAETSLSVSTMKYLAICLKPHERVGLQLQIEINGGESF
jgi:2-keto-3-deoxy-L-rhamnonate aldolase RhmA